MFIFWSIYHLYLHNESLNIYVLGKLMFLDIGLCMPKLVSLILHSIVMSETLYLIWFFTPGAARQWCQWWCRWRSDWQQGTLGPWTAEWGITEGRGGGKFPCGRDCQHFGGKFTAPRTLCIVHPLKQKIITMMSLPHEGQWLYLQDMSSNLVWSGIFMY